MSNDYDPFYNDSYADEFSVEESPTDGYKLYSSPIKILVAIVCGFVGMIINNILMAVFMDKLWNPLLIALCFLIEALLIGIPILFISCFLTSDKFIFTRKKENSSGLRLLFPLSFVAIFLFSGLFEFLYEISSDKPCESTSYIFALDISGSMEESDKEHQLAQAMSTMIENMDDGSVYSVYAFNDNVYQICEPHERENADLSIDWDQTYGGGTALFTTMDTILESAKDKSVYGETPRIIIITDGHPTDGGLLFSNLNKYCKKFSKRNINVFTIGVAGADTNFLTTLSSKTGGVSYYTNDMSTLGDIFTTAVHTTTTSTRTLLSYRSYTTHDGLLAFLHILFTFIICLLFIPVFYFANCIEEDLSYVVFFKGITALLGSILLEVFLQYTDLGGLFILLIFGLLTGLSFLRTWKNKKEAEESEDELSDPYITSYTETCTSTLGNLENKYGSDSGNSAFGRR